MSLPAAPEFVIENIHTVPYNAQPYANMEETNQGYDLSFGIPSGKPMVIWDGNKPLELIGSDMSLQNISKSIVIYLNENMGNNHPLSANELLPITYIYNIDFMIDRGQSIEGDVVDNTLVNIQEYEYNIIEDEQLSIQLVTNELQDLITITDKSIIGFFGYWANEQWNIFLAPNGASGKGAIEWQIAEGV